MTGILEPLAARYAHWLGLPVEETSLPEAAPDAASDAASAGSVLRDTRTRGTSVVRAMPIVLRMEKAEPPPRTALLEAAASAALAVCLKHSQPGGEWHEPVHAWVSGHIRKVARCARGAHWQAAQEFPGVTVTVDGAQARALVPGRVVDTPKEISRLQISGSELPPDAPGPPATDIPLLLLNPEVAMTVGKAAAQVGHGTMILASLLEPGDLAAWAERGYRCAVRTPTVARWKDLHPGDDPAGAWRDRGVVAVRDAGFTEVDPGTVTVLAQWPSSGCAR